ncbi:hypothetical protein DB345_02855 [Spartobacteria bacterium LR76]|nr:hypothetical protein DB345_02855 [Spartobacteria bacterium LR76]
MPEQAKATWAAHRIIAEPGNPKLRPIAVKLAEDKRSVQVFLPTMPEKSPQGYFLIKAKARLPRESLEFRMSMMRWFMESERYQKKRATFDRHFVDASDKAEYADIDRFREITRLAPERKDGAGGIFLEMSVEDAMRSYIVRDYLPNGGAMVDDGGFGDTYDLPAIVEAAREAKE